MQTFSLILQVFQNYTAFLVSMSTGPTDTTYTAYNMANILCHLTYDEDFYILIQVQRSRCDFRVNGYFPAVYNFCMENGK